MFYQVVDTRNTTTDTVQLQCKPVSDILIIVCSILAVTVWASAHSALSLGLSVSHTHTANEMQVLVEKSGFPTLAKALLQANIDGTLAQLYLRKRVATQLMKSCPLPNMTSWPRLKNAVSEGESPIRPIWEMWLRSHDPELLGMRGCAYALRGSCTMSCPHAIIVS